MDSPKPILESPEAKLHFLDYWRVIRVRKAVILIVFLLVTITTTVVTFMIQPTFASMAKITIDKDQSSVPGIEGRQSASGYDPFWLQTELNRIKSPSVLDVAISNLDLATTWGNKYNGGTKLEIDVCREQLIRLINVQEVRNTSVIEIWAYSYDRQEAANVANAIAKSYLDSRRRYRSSGKSESIAVFDRKIEEMDRAIKKAQGDLSEMARTNNVFDYQDATAYAGGRLLNAEKLQKYAENMVEAELGLRKYSTLYQQLTNNSPTQLRYVLQQVYPDPGLATLLDQLAGAHLQVVKYAADLNDAHPDLVRAKKIQETVESQVDEKVLGMMKALATQVATYEAMFERAKTKEEEMKTEALEAVVRYRPYADAKKSIEEMQRVRSAENLRRESERVELDLPTPSMVDITGPAEPGRNPYRPKKPLNIGLGLIVGLILGVGLAFFIEYLDTSVKTIDDVERTLQAQVLAVIPQNVGSLLDEGPESPHAEAYRVLRTNVLFARKSDGANTITVISGGAGEGKSTTLFNLAMVFAQSGARVLVVDSDLRRPSLHKILRLSNGIGLTNYLLKQNTLEEVIQTTGQASLDFMPSGKLPSSSIGILSSPQMKEMIWELKRRYDYVFFDSPPIMGVSDAQILASEVDMVLQVIQYRRYPQQMTIRTKQMIQKVGGNLLGLVLNNINMSQDENYYYYSGYYHDYYSKNEESAAKPKPAVNGKETPGVKGDIKPKY